MSPDETRIFRPHPGSSAGAGTARRVRPGDRTPPIVVTPVLATSISRVALAGGHGADVGTMSKYIQPTDSGFFDKAVRLEELDAMGDPLARLDEVVDWTLFAPVLARLPKAERFEQIQRVQLLHEFPRRGRG